MHVRDNVLKVVLIALISCSVYGQNSSPLSKVECPSSGRRCGNDGGCISSVLFLSECKHVQLTRSALAIAINNPDPAVRTAAADVLAHHLEITGLTKDDVIPILVGALVEKKTRWDIALTLTSLGAPEGFSAFREICDDKSWNTFQRVTAGKVLADAGDDHCLNIVLSIAESESDENRVSALTTLADYKQISPDQRNLIFGLLTQALTDQVPQVKYLASLELVRLGNPEAIPYFEKAIALEKDSATKVRFETDLQRLRDRKP